MRSRLIALFLGVALAGAAVTAGAPSASAALAPTGCGFHFGTVTQQGATGTVFYSVVLQPLSPAQRCTLVIPFTASATVAPVLVAKTGPYTNIDDNPLHAVQTVSFVPGRLPPTLTVAWADFHCADPAVPGRLDIAALGQTLAIEITPNSCGPAGAPHSRLESLPIPVAPSAVGIAATSDDQGYRTVTQSGAVTAEGNATALATPLTHAPIVAIQSTPTGNGVWLVAADGGVFSYGSAAFQGSLGAIHLNAPIVGAVATPTGNGYWLVASDGGVFSFGDATFHGSLGALHLNAPIVAMAATADGHGYWLTAADGGVFAFGTAPFSGSMGSVLLNAPVVGMAAGPHGGYWLAGSDGSVFAFGGVPFEGSMGATRINAPVSGMAATNSGRGYWLVGADNGIFTFGDARFFGSAPVGS
jgi:uncharacterized membrane protein YgdD (TMEM256/DUF423 family)